MADWKGGRARREPNRESKSSPKRTATPVRAGGAWRGRGSRSGSQGGDWGLWFKRLLTSGLVLAVLGTLVVVLWLYQVPTRIVVLSTQSYPADTYYAFPARPGGGTPKFSGTRTYLNFVGHEGGEESSLINQLGSVSNSKVSFGGPDKNVFVISIMAQGTVNRNGEPCLLDRKSEPFNDKTWTTFESIFDQLKEKIDVKKTNRHVVVFLDSGTAETDWSIGVLKDDFRERLSALVEQSEKRFLPDRWHLIHVRGLTDLSTFAKTGRRLLFADVLDCGLRGAADRNDDQKISLTEIKNYIESKSGVLPDIYPKVAPKSQKPLDANPNLCWAERNKQKPEPVPFANSRTFERWHLDLERLWTDHLALDGEKPWRFFPWDWARFEHQLLRAERAVIAGDEELAQKCLHLARLQHDNLKGKTRKQRDRQDQFTASPMTFDTTEAKAILDSTETSELPAASGRMSPVTALALLLRRDVMGSPDSVAATQVRSNSFAFTELIGLRSIAETAVWPADFRAESILRNQADMRNDKQRLNLEDVAFIGGKQQLDSLPDHIRKARADYEATASFASDFVVALDQRDELLAKLPWALRWAELKRSKSDQDDLMSLWKDTVEKLRIFETPILDREATVDLDGWKEISSRFDRYLKLSDEARKHQEDDKWLSSPREWVRGAIPFFATPLVSDQRRRELRTRLIEVLNNSNAAEKVEQEAAKDKTDELPFDRWETHPLRAMFAHDDVSSRNDSAPSVGLFPSNDKLTAGEFKPVENWIAGATIRDEYFNLPDKKIWSEAYSKQINSHEELAKNYRELIAYDTLGRSQAVALCAGEELKHSSPQNVISRLDQLQIATYYDWRVSRSINDFYGPTNALPSSNGTTDFTNAFFHAQASEWVKKLESLPEDGRPIGQVLAERWKGILETLSKFASPCISIELGQTEVVFPAVDPDPQSIKVTVKAQPVKGIRVEGTSALECPKYDPDTGNQNRDRRRVPLTWAAPSTVTEDVKLAPGNETLAIRCYFRGHVAKETTVNLVREKPKVSIDREIPIYESTSPNSQVTVKGIAPQRLWIMVVLDCSASMKELMASAEDSSSKIPRFDVAKQALRDMLGTLLKESRDEQTDLHVGLMAYGYRSGITQWEDGRWSVGFAHPQLEKILPLPPDVDEDTDAEYREPKLRNLDPSLDVGILAPLVGSPRWDQNAYDKIKRLIDRRIPIGNTPLYLSIVKAADHMQSLPAEDQKWIVVLTDGVDNQETLEDNASKRAAWKLVGLVQPKTGETVAERALQAHSHLHVRIVGIGIPDRATAVKALKAATNSQNQQNNALIVSGLDSLERFCASKKDPNGNSMRELIFTQNGEELAKQLTVHIPPVYFRAVQTPSAGDPRLIPSERLGNRLELKNSEGKDYMIEVLRGEGESATVLASSNPLHMYGGERFGMVYMNTSKNLLFHRGWENIENKAIGVSAEQNALIGHLGVRDKSRDVKNFTSQTGERWQAALVVPQRIVVNNRVGRQFRVAFRPMNETKSPARPIFLRAVVTPVMNEPVTTTIPYYFESHDIRYVANEPLPVIEFEATDWKNEWKQANLSLWIRSPGDDALKPDDIQILPSVLDAAGTDMNVALPVLGGHLKLKFEKEVRNPASDEVSLKIHQSWGTGARPSDVEDLPILQLFPPPKRYLRSIQLDQEHIGYTYVFPGESERTKAYELRVLDPSTLPHTREPNDAIDPQNVVKKLWWEKIVVE